MGLLLKVRRGTGAILALLLALSSLLWALPVQAQGGFALSGSFYAQDFELPQGSSLSAPDVYVVVFNNSQGNFKVRITTDTPVGVTLVPSENDFALNAGEQKKVLITLEVGAEAAPGDYEIGLTAEPYTEGASGIQIIGAAGQTANLTVTGDAASVEVTTTSPDGAPIPAMIRLHREVEGKLFEIGFSETGSLKVTVSPGSYKAFAYVAGKEMAEEDFTLATNEDKKIELSVKTVFFEGFGIVPNYDAQTKKMAMAQIVYAVNNLLQEFPQAEVRLKVSLDNAPLEEVSLINLNPLPKSKQELNYNYIPAGGWTDSAYGFKLELLTDGEVYTTSPEKVLGESGNTNTSSGPVNWVLLGGIAGGAALLVIVIVVVLRLTR